MAHPPSVDRLARSLRTHSLPDPLLVEAARTAIAEAVLAHGPTGVDPAAVTARAEELIAEQSRRLLQPVINATGVLLHTNLGRAPFSLHHDASYSNVEFRLDQGTRGSRSEHAGTLLARACGAEAALVVNNNAAAVLLTLAAIGGPGRAAVASRGELVEIGGGFRIPDVMTASGTELIEVGTTNRTRRADYERAIATAGERIGLLLKVHQSNYRITGFTETVEVSELVGLGQPVVADIGSGLLDASCPWLANGPPAWLAGEPAARQTLAEGADLVLFSGDKLLGGPQAGIIAGRADLVALIGKHPLYRAVRCGGLVLRAVQDLALAYLDRRGADIPFWHMATGTVAELAVRARTIAGAVPGAHPEAMLAVPGGGTLPGVTIESFGLVLDGDHRDALRQHQPPVIARVQDDRTMCDLRTVAHSDDVGLAAALAGLGTAR